MQETLVWRFGFIGKHEIEFEEYPMFYIYMLPWKGFGSRAGFSHPGSGNMAQYFEKGNNFLLTIYDTIYESFLQERGTWIQDPDPVLQRGVLIETLQEAKCSRLFTLLL